MKACLHNTVGMSDGKQSSTFVTCCRMSVSCVLYLDRPGSSSTPADQTSMSWLMLGGYDA